MKSTFLGMNLVVGSLVVTIAVLVFMPVALTRDQVRQELAVIGTLERIAVAQHAFRIAGTTGRYGTLEELRAAAPDGEPWLPLKTRGEGDTLRFGDYRVRLYLPDAEGRPAPAGEGGFDARVASKAFLAVAWPADARKAPYRAFAVGADLLVNEHRNAGGEWSGERLPDAQLPPLASIDPVTREAASVGLPRGEWSHLVKRGQRIRVAKRLARFGIDLPSWLVGKEGDGEED